MILDIDHGMCSSDHLGSNPRMQCQKFQYLYESETDRVETNRWNLTLQCLITISYEDETLVNIVNILKNLLTCQDLCALEIKQKNTVCHLDVRQRPAQEIG